MEFGSTTIKQINFVVKYLDKIVKGWTKLTGRGPEMEYYIPPFDKVPAFTDGIPEECSDVKTAKFKINDKEVFSPITLAFWQPREAKTPWRKHLDKYGEGFMDIEFTVSNLDKAYEFIGEKPYHKGYYSSYIYSLAHTKDMHGTDLNIGQLSDNRELLNELKKKYNR